MNLNCIVSAFFRLAFSIDNKYYSTKTDRDRLTPSLAWEPIENGLKTRCKGNVIALATSQQSLLSYVGSPTSNLQSTFYGVQYAFFKKKRRRHDNLLCQILTSPPRPFIFLVKKYIYILHKKKKKKKKKREKGGESEKRGRQKKEKIKEEKDENNLIASIPAKGCYTKTLSSIYFSRNFSDTIKRLKTNAIEGS
jgi:hypothetical protein